MTFILCSWMLSAFTAYGYSFQSTTIDITIAYTHDLHSHLYSEWTGSSCSGGMSVLSTKVQELRALRPVLLLDCGDAMTGAPVNDHNNGIPMIEVMNAIGYDAMALDNHEFDPGVSALKDMISIANFEILSANVDWPGDPKPLPYSIETIAGYDIGIIGLTPLFWYSPPEVVFDNLVTAANNAVAELQGLGIEFIILLGCVSSSLASSVSGLDLIVKGGSLETIGNTLVLPSIGADASHIGVLDLTLETADGTIDSYSFSSHSLGSSIRPDETIVSIIDEWNEPFAAEFDTSVGYFGEEHSISELGTLLAESIYQFSSADVGTYNFGGIRASIDSGFVTYRDIYKMEPFFNFVATIELKGDDVTAIIGSNYAVTGITSFDPSTWYTVASANFSITNFERIYSPDTRNRQDFTSVSVVEVFAEYVEDAFPITSPNILDVIDDCRSSVIAIPDSYLDGGTPSTLKALINDALLFARNSIVAGNETDAIAQLLIASERIETHIAVSCPVRWLKINIQNIISFLELSMTTTTITSPTDSTIPTTSSDGSIFDSPWTPVLVIELIILSVSVGYIVILRRLRGNLNRG